MTFDLLVSPCRGPPSPSPIAVWRPPGSSRSPGRRCQRYWPTAWSPPSCGQPESIPLALSGGWSSVDCYSPPPYLHRGTCSRKLTSDYYFCWNSFSCVQQHVWLCLHSVAVGWQTDSVITAHWWRQTLPVINNLSASTSNTMYTERAQHTCQRSHTAASYKSRRDAGSIPLPYIQPLADSSY